MNTKNLVLILTGFVLLGILGYALFTTQWEADIDTSKLCEQVPGAPDGVRLLPTGIKAPRLTFSSLDGEAYHLRDFRGQKAVLLELFATWCPHCQHSMPALKDIARQFRGTKFEIIAVNAGDSSSQGSTTDTFRKQHGVTYPIAEKPELETLDNLCLSSYPTFYLIDLSGNIVWRHTGTLVPGKPLDELKALLAEIKGT